MAEQRELKKKLSLDEKDLRIDKATLVRKTLGDAGFKIIQEDYEKIRQKAFDDLRNEKIVGDDLRLAQITYNLIEEWLAIPKSIIEEGRAAMQEPKERSAFRKIKKKIPFLDRNY